MKKEISWLLSKGYSIRVDHDYKNGVPKKYYDVSYGFNSYGNRLTRKQLYWFYKGVRAERGEV